MIDELTTPALFVNADGSTSIRRLKKGAPMVNVRQRPHQVAGGAELKPRVFRRVVGTNVDALIYREVEAS